MDSNYLNALATTIMNLSSKGYSSFDFANSFRGKQIESKQWLVDNLDIDPKKVLILGSWYGNVLPHMLIQKYNIQLIDCVDSDPSVRLGAHIFSHVMGYGHLVNHHTSDAKTFMLTNDLSKYDLIINTSCEHMPFDMNNFIEPNVTYALESNNYYGIEGHVNCKESARQFAESTGLNNITVCEEKDMGNYTRFLVVGTYG